jgi:hypothetical protein
MFYAVLRIRAVYPGSEFFPSRIQGQKDSGSRIRIIEFECLKPKKLFLSFRKNDLRCSSRIRIQIFFHGLPFSQTSPSPRISLRRLTSSYTVCISLYLTACHIRYRSSTVCVARSHHIFHCLLKTSVSFRTVPVHLVTFISAVPLTLALLNLLKA